MKNTYITNLWRFIEMTRGKTFDEVGCSGGNAITVLNSDESFVGKDLSRTVLVGTRFENADLRGTNLYAADLRNANLYGVKLDKSTVLEKANMSGVYGMPANALVGIEPHLLHELLQNSSQSVRLAIIFAYRKYGKQQAIEDLLHLLKNESPKVRAEAISALADVEGKEVINAIRLL